MRSNWRPPANKLKQTTSKSNINKRRRRILNLQVQEVESHPSCQSTTRSAYKHLTMTLHIKKSPRKISSNRTWKPSWKEIYPSCRSFWILLIWKRGRKRTKFQTTQRYSLSMEGMGFSRNHWKREDGLKTKTWIHLALIWSGPSEQKISITTHFNIINWWIISRRLKQSPQK